MLCFYSINASAYYFARGGGIEREWQLGLPGHVTTCTESWGERTTEVYLLAFLVFRKKTWRPCRWWNSFSHLVLAVSVAFDVLHANPEMKICVVPLLDLLTGLLFFVVNQHDSHLKSTDVRSLTTFPLYFLSSTSILIHIDFHMMIHVHIIYKKWNNKIWYPSLYRASFIAVSRGRQNYMRGKKKTMKPNVISTKTEAWPVLGTRSKHGRQKRFIHVVRAVLAQRQKEKWIVRQHTHTHTHPSPVITIAKSLVLSDNFVVQSLGVVCDSTGGIGRAPIGQSHQKKNWQAREWNN